MNEKTTAPGPAQEVIQKHRDYLYPATATYYKEALVPESASGLRVRDHDGREYLDFFGGILTISIGHCDPRITGAVKAQVDRLGHVSSLYPTLPVVELAETLAKITPGDLKQSYFTASGTEADETAVVLAQVFTEAQEIIALRHGYSGRSLLAQALCGHASWRAVPSQVASVKHAASPYCYRCPLGLTYPSCEVKCAQDIEDVIKTTTVGKIAAFIAEPIQGVGGFITPPPEYFPIAVDIIRKYGGLFICDEVQTGFGRTGSKMFGIEHWGVKPDIMTMAKGVANGMPLGITIATEEIARAFTAMTISTFGGNPVSAAAANATIAVMEEENLPENSHQQGLVLRKGLKKLQSRYTIIGDVRGMGLMQGVELVKDEMVGDRTPLPEGANQLFEETRKRGLLIGKGGLYGNVIRISPPLTVTEVEVEEALGILDESFAAMEKTT